MGSDLLRALLTSKSSYGPQKWKEFSNIRKKIPIYLYVVLTNLLVCLSHNDSIRCVQYNPKSHQLLSCTASDFGLWSPEQKTVTKNKTASQINCCAWNEEGSLFVLGLNSGTVSVRLKVSLFSDYFILPIGHVFNLMIYSCAHTGVVR